MRSSKTTPKLRATRVASPNEPQAEAAALRANRSLRRQAWSHGIQPFARGQHPRAGIDRAVVFAHGTVSIPRGADSVKQGSARKKLAMRIVACAIAVAACACAGTDHTHVATLPAAAADVALAATAPASCDAAPGKDHAALVAWHRTVRALPLFAAVAVGAPAACEISAVDGVLRVGYRFADGTRIEANRDPAIEYVSVALRFAPAKRLDVQPVLAATERALFGASGCGIDWTRPSGAPAASASAIATQFEGASCNCRALVQRSVDGAAISAGLSATC